MTDARGPGCLNALQFSLAQQQVIYRAVDEHKWYMSERVGYDVGYLAALQDFMQHHMHRLAAEFRSRFCMELCPARLICGLAALVPDLNASYALRRCPQC